jgi:hypothetical protein
MESGSSTDRDFRFLVLAPSRLINSAFFIRISMSRHWSRATSPLRPPEVRKNLNTAVSILSAGAKSLTSSCG